VLSLRRGSGNDNSPEGLTGVATLIGAVRSLSRSG
jgi:hypothetical protein